MQLSAKLSKLLLLVVLLLLVIGLIHLGIQNHHLSQRVDKLSNDLASNTTLLGADIATNQAYERPVVDKNADYVYLPELQIKLPFSSLSKSVEYSMRADSGVGGNAGKTEADVTSAFFRAPPQPTRVACGDMLRIAIEAKPHTYSPHEKALSVSLSDGRTLQIYELVSETECTNSWDLSVSPSQLAIEFQKAQSY